MKRNPDLSPARTQVVWLTVIHKEGPGGKWVMKAGKQSAWCAEAQTSGLRKGDFNVRTVVYCL